MRLICCDIASEFPATVDKEMEYHQWFTDQELDPNYPNYHQFFQQLFNQLKTQHFAKHGDTEQRWVADFPAQFANHFSELVSIESESYPNACKYIASLRHEEPPASKLIRYHNSLIAEVEQQPLAIDQQLNLRDSYVSPSLIIREKAPSIAPQQQKVIWHRCLLTSLIEVIENRIDTNPIVLHGQPGHGKTSSMRMLSRSLLGLYSECLKSPIVLFLEFRKLGRLNRTITEVFAEQVNFVRDESFFWGHHSIIILDGLDERQVTDGEGDQQLRQFVIDLFNFSERLNKHNNTRCNLILTGRSQFVGEIQSCFIKKHYVIDIADFNGEQQALWFKKFNRQKQLKDDDLTIRDLENYQLQELLKQPILLAICAIMLTDSEGKKLIAKQEGQEISRALVYYIIIEWAYYKKWHHEPNVASWQDRLSFTDYFILLQAIAFIMVKKGVETIKLSDLVNALDSKQLKGLFVVDVLNNVGRQDLERLCSQLRISFFFSGVEEKAFSFIHKSFKDFLYSTCLIDAGINLLAEFNPKRPERTDEDVFSLYGQTPLSYADHMWFFREWLKIKLNENNVVDSSIIYDSNGKTIEYWADNARDLWRHISNLQIEIKQDIAVNQLQRLANVIFNVLQLVAYWFSYLDESKLEQLFNKDGYIDLFDNQTWHWVHSLFDIFNLKHQWYVKQLPRSS